MRALRLQSHSKIRLFRSWIITCGLSLIFGGFVVFSFVSGLSYLSPRNLQRDGSYQASVPISSSKAFKIKFLGYWRSGNVLTSVKHSIEAPPTVPFQRVIWQTAKSHYGAPKSGVELFNTWTSLNPSWDHIIWDDDEVDAFVGANYNATVLEAFRALPLGVMRADVFRYMVIHKHGGVYADADTECLKPVEEWVRPECKFTVALENDLHFCQWAFAAVPHHEAMSKVMEYVLDKVVHRQYDTQYEHFVHATTGPGIFTGALRAYLQSIGVHIKEFDVHDLNDVLAREWKKLRQQGVCMLSRDELEAVMINQYSSSSDELKSTTWISWTDEVSKLQSR